MWFQYCTAVFRMELSTDEPFQGRNFDNFYQIRIRIDTYTLHTGIFKFSLEVVVEFIAVTVTFLNVCVLICLISP